jgi:hypothetical protein
LFRFAVNPYGSCKKAAGDISVSKERGFAARQKGDSLNYEKQPVFPFACFHTKYLKPT